MEKERAGRLERTFQIESTGPGVNSFGRGEGRRMDLLFKPHDSTFHDLIEASQQFCKAGSIISLFSGWFIACLVLESHFAGPDSIDLGVETLHTYLIPLCSMLMQTKERNTEMRNIISFL